MCALSITETPGFEGHFCVVCSSVCTDPERQFADRVDRLMRWYKDATLDTQNALARLRVLARNQSVRELRVIAEDAVKGSLAPELAVLSSYVVQGRWEIEIKKVNSAPFIVEEIDEFGNIVNKIPDSFASDLSIHVADTQIPIEKTNFKVELDRTITVIKVILPTHGRMFRKTRQRLTRRRSDYIRKLAGIARIGLHNTDPTLTSLATQSLNSFRDEIVALEAGAVKNRYLWRLGWRSLAMAAATALGFYLTMNYACPMDYATINKFTICHDYPILFKYRNFLLLSCGTAVGTWVSFSLRKVILSFLDLAAIEEDRLDPTIRVLFITALATVVGLLFWTSAVTIGIGDFKSDFEVTGSYALLIGLLLGIAERTMATAVSKRATDFAAGIGGK